MHEGDKAIDLTSSAIATLKNGKWVTATGKTYTSEECKSLVVYEFHEYWQRMIRLQDYPRSSHNDFKFGFANLGLTHYKSVCPINYKSTQWTHEQYFESISLRRSDENVLDLELPLPTSRRYVL